MVGTVVDVIISFVRLTVVDDICAFDCVENPVSSTVGTPVGWVASVADGAAVGACVPITTPILWTFVFSFVIAMPSSAAAGVVTMKEPAFTDRITCSAASSACSCVVPAGS